MIEEFRAAVERNSGTVHGPYPRHEAVATLVGRAVELALGKAVAVPVRDPVLEAHGVVGALRDAGLPVVAPTHSDWRVAVARAAVGVTGAPAAAAETGTVAVVCGPGAPRAVSLLPDAHLCLVPASVVEPDLAAALARVTSAGLPPALVWVSGPSRSADIDKRITLGVHGPRTFEVVLVAE